MKHELVAHKLSTSALDLARIVSLDALSFERGWSIAAWRQEMESEHVSVRVAEDLGGQVLGYHCTV